MRRSRNTLSVFAMYHLCITFFLDTQAVLILKGPFGQVLQVYLLSNRLCYFVVLCFFIVLPRMA